MGTCFPEHPSPSIPPGTASGRVCQENGGPFLDGKGDVGLDLVLGTPCLASPQPWVSLSLSLSERRAEDAALLLLAEQDDARLQRAGRHSPGGAASELRPKSPVITQAGGAGWQTRRAGRRRVSGLGLSGMPEDVWAWLEHRGSGGPAHPGAGGRAGSVGWHRRAVVSGPCTLSPWRMQGHQLKAAFSLPQGYRVAQMVQLGGKQCYACSVPLYCEQGSPKPLWGHWASPLPWCRGWETVLEHWGAAGHCPDSCGSSGWPWR